MKRAFQIMDRISLEQPRMLFGMTHTADMSSI